MDGLSKMEKEIIRYVGSGIVTAERLSWEVVAPWESIEYCIKKLIAAGLLQQNIPFIYSYSLTAEGEKIMAVIEDGQD